MTFREKVAALYDRFPQPRTFEEDLRLYRLNGYVIETDELFLVGRAVNHEASQDLICDPGHAFPRIEQDAWFIHAMAGSMVEVYRAMPYFLPLVGWIRRNGLIRWHWVEDAHERVIGLEFLSRYV